MGKRKHKSSRHDIKDKIRKLEKRLRRFHSSDSDSSHDDDVDRGWWSPESAHHEDQNSIRILSDSEEVSTPEWNIHSIVNPMGNQSNQSLLTAAVDPTVAGPSQPTVVDDSNCSATAATLPAHILEVLGDAKSKQEVFGPKIQEEISKRWGRILCDGLNKDLKKGLSERVLVPENFQLVKAPKLNPEIAAVMTETNMNRDKRLEKAQNYLGVGISILTDLTSNLIEKDLDKMEIIKRLSEANQILLDLHFENTLNRRKLISYTLDKRFLEIILDVKRDSLLFGENLSEKIKASKSAEKSGLQVKKSQAPESSTSKKQNSRQGNGRAPPRHAQRGNRQGGTRSHPTQQGYQSARRPPPMNTNRFQNPSKSQPKQPPKTQ